MSLENSPVISRSAPPPFSELMEEIEKNKSPETSNSPDLNFYQKNCSNFNALEMYEIKEEDELLNSNLENNDELEKNENFPLLSHRQSSKFDDSESTMSLDKKKLNNSSILMDINDFNPEFYMSEEAHQNELHFGYSNSIVINYSKIIKKMLI